jgi:hypothetical protein
VEEEDAGERQGWAYACEVGKVVRQSGAGPFPFTAVWCGLRTLWLTAFVRSDGMGLNHWCRSYWA